MRKNPLGVAGLRGKKKRQRITHGGKNRYKRRPVYWGSYRGGRWKGGTMPVALAMGGEMVASERAAAHGNGVEGTGISG